MEFSLPDFPQQDGSSPPDAVVDNLLFADLIQEEEDDMMDDLPLTDPILKQHNEKKEKTFMEAKRKAAKKASITYSLAVKRIALQHRDRRQGNREKLSTTTSKQDTSKHQQICGKTQS